MHFYSRLDQWGIWARNTAKYAVICSYPSPSDQSYTSFADDLLSCISINLYLSSELCQSHAAVFVYPCQDPVYIKLAIIKAEVDDCKLYSLYPKGALRATFYVQELDWKTVTEIERSLEFERNDVYQVTRTEQKYWMQCTVMRTTLFVGYLRKRLFLRVKV